MSSLVKVLFAGLLISLLGTLPFGVLNVRAFQISHADGIESAFLFAAGVVVVELTYLRLTLFSSQWLNKQPWVAKLSWLGILVFGVMALNSFRNIFSHATDTDVLLDFNYPFIEGMLLSVVNPLQIPFWLGWNAVLLSKNILRTDRHHYNYYLAGAGVGTISGLGIFILCGWFIKGNTIVVQYWMNIGITILYTLCLLNQIAKFSKMKLSWPITLE